MKRETTTFSLRDLLVMAALAALGGVASTYVNALGDAVHAVVGVPGTTQWAAGLHVVWLTLAVGLTGRQGSGTITGILKGVVELLSGNTHGLLVLLVDVVAGLLVDLGFLAFRKKRSLPPFLLAGGLASASNVFVFQLFASLPADTLAYWAMIVVGLVAGGSGVVFAGLLGWSLMRALRRAGVLAAQEARPMKRWVYAVFLIVAVALTVGFTITLRTALKGPATVHIGGAVEAPYDYPDEHGDIAEVVAEATMRDVTSRYEGVPIRTLIERAGPSADAGMLLIRASDGYAFFVSMEEVQENESLLLACEGRGDDASCNVVGAENSKAWVRGVSDMTVIESTTLPVEGALETPGVYDPDEWQFEMESTSIDLDDGPRKLQGAPLGMVLEAQGLAEDAESVVLETPDERTSLPLSEVLSDDGLRIFTVIDEGRVSFAAARMDGEVVAAPLQRIEVE